MFCNEMWNEGFDVKCENDATLLLEGCEDGYVVAHYKEPRQMMCLLVTLAYRKLEWSLVHNR